MALSFRRRTAVKTVFSPSDLVFHAAKNSAVSDGMLLDLQLYLDTIHEGFRSTVKDQARAWLTAHGARKVPVISDLRELYVTSSELYSVFTEH